MPPPTEPQLIAFAATLRDVLTARLGDDYSEGSVLGDLLVDAHSILLGEFAQELTDLRLRQSLRDLRALAPSAERDAAIEGLLSNLFLQRDLGRFSRGYATLIFSQRVDTIVPRTTRFFRTAALVFYPNLSQDLLIAASALRPVYNPQGSVTGWAYDVPLIAARTGPAYDITPGVFTFVDPFSGYLQRVVNNAKYQGGVNPTTSEALLEQAEGSLGLRALLSPRSNEATLRTAFAEVSRVLTVGFGDPEMCRDQQAIFGRATALHLGGHQDLYVRLPLMEVTSTSIIGGAVSRADGLILLFHDSAATFATNEVAPGAVLNITAGPTGAPAQYVVRSVTETELTVGVELPFGEATDERTPLAPSITYSIGDNYPDFDNMVAAATSATARTSRQLSIPGCALLPPGPVYEILRVEILDPPAELLPYVSPDTGTVLFTARRNNPWARAPNPGEALSYRVRVENPREAQSSRTVLGLELGWPDLLLEGVSVEITYATLAGFSSVDAFVRSPEQQTPGANLLLRAEHPIYLSAALTYRARTAVDETALVATLLQTIEASAPGNFEVSTLTTTLLNAEPNLNSVRAVTLTYELHLPDGRVARYQTEDRIQVLPNGTSSARLVNAADLGLPNANTLSHLRALLESHGVSDRVVRYLSDADRLTLEAQG